MLSLRVSLTKEKTQMPDGMITSPIGHSPEGSPAYTYGGGVDYGQMRIIDFNTNAIQNYYKGISGFWGNTNKAFDSMLTTYYKWEKWKFDEEQETLKYTMNLMKANPELASELLSREQRRLIMERLKRSRL
jgi:hypothetical protein